ncbi:MAG: hypothetical protein SWY16_26650 [Cyanobacteriota bacterium]|nr:hypothetical protein [Cyanobacteriota bacterium]
MNPKLSSLIDRKPSIARVILTDNTSFTLSLFVLITGIFIVTIPIGLLLLYFLIKRVHFIQSVFARGVPVKALIIGKRFIIGAWQLRYQYTYQNKDYESSNRIFRLKIGVCKGDILEAFLNPQKQAESAFLTKFYLGDKSSE